MLTSMQLIIATDKEERRRLLSSRLKRSLSSAQIFYPETFSLSDFFQEVETRPFLQASKVLVIEEIDRLESTFKEGLLEYCKRPADWIDLYLTATSLSSQTKLYKAVQAKGEIVHLKSEKPWERKERHTHWIQTYVQEHGASISSQTAEALIKAVDASTLQSELDKLLNYVEEGGEITLQAIHALSTPMHRETLWQLSDALLALESAIALRIGRLLIHEGLSLFALLGHLRKQFESTDQMLQILRTEGKTGVSVAFPKLSPQFLDKKIRLAGRFGQPRSKRALLLIYETELRAKSQAVDPALLIEILIIQVTHDTHSSSQSSRSRLFTPAR